MHEPSAIQQSISTDTMKNALNWFEIPVKNFERAKTFYSKVLGTDIGEMPFPDGRYGIIAWDQEGVGGGLRDDRIPQRRRGPQRSAFAGGNSRREDSDAQNVHRSERFHGPLHGY
jgi:predicted enzyme related to lactoylglutathione lyase